MNKMILLTVFLSFCLSVFLPFCLSVFLSFCLSVFLSFCISVCLSYLEKTLDVLNKKETTVCPIPFWLSWHFWTEQRHCLFIKQFVFSIFFFYFRRKICSKNSSNLQLAFRRILFFDGIKNADLLASEKEKFRIVRWLM